MDKRRIYSIKMLSMVSLNVVDASDEDQFLPSSNFGSAAARPRRPPLVVISDSSLMNGCQWVIILGRLGSYIYVLGVPWGVLHLALHEILLGREANLVYIKSASSRFS
jgi:hypothetical protein